MKINKFHDFIKIYKSKGKDKQLNTKMTNYTKRQDAEET